jgi:EAL domain-containing protein (putative c-di-GMP-specific phosphodiesterase class I)
MTALMPQVTLASELRRILEEGLVRSVYQPIVDIDTLEVVAYEALAGGPGGSGLERPDLLFATAHEIGAVEELEWAGRAAALAGALETGLRQTLFVNVEPSLLDAAIPSPSCWSAPAASSTSCSSSPSAR